MPFDNGYELGTTNPVQEDINGGILVDSFFAKRKIKKIRKKTHADLIKAIRNDDMKTLAQIIYFGNLDLTPKDSSNFSAMDWAVGCNRPIAVNLLLKANVKPDDHHPNVLSPLLVAIDPKKTFYGKHTCAKLLIRADADIMQTDTKEESALIKIIKMNMADLFEDIYSYKVDKHTLTNEGEPLLLYAAKHAENDILQNIMNWGFNIKDKTPRQETILHILAARPHKEKFIQKAIEQGVSINAVDILGNTALHYAAQNAQYNNVEILLKAGASPLIKNYKQELPKDKINRKTYSDTAVSKTSALLADAMCSAYQKILEETKNQEPKKITDQKPPFNLNGNSNQHQPE